MDGVAVNINVGSDTALAFGLLFARAAGVIFALPKMLGVPIPPKVRMALALLLAAALMPMAAVAMPVASGPLALAAMVVRELILGLMLTFATALVVGAVMTAGDVIGAGMELNSGAIFRGEVRQPNVLADGLGALAGLMFFVGGFHRALLLALGRSLAAAPLGALALPDPRAIVRLSGDMFMIALQLGLPVMVPLLVLSLAQGVISRLAPQVNILVAAPAAIILAGITLIGMDALGLTTGMLRAWSAIMTPAMSWTNA